MAKKIKIFILLSSLIFVLIAKIVWSSFHNVDKKDEIGALSLEECEKMNMKDSLLILHSPFECGDTIFYTNCANEVYFPPNCIYSDFSLSMSGAEVIKKQYSFWIIPKDTGSLNVLNILGKKGGKVVCEIAQNVKIINPPKPSIVLYCNGKQLVNDRKITRYEAISSKILFKIQPDSIFAVKCPDDSKYQITEVTLFEGNNQNRKGGKDLSDENVNKGIAFPIPMNFSLYHEKTIIYHIKDIKRKTFDGRTVLCKEFTEEEKDIVIRKKADKMERLMNK